MKYDSRPPIPAALMRGLRQESSFGCSRCGNPIIEYHHIIPWAEVHKHDFCNLIVLCPICHHRANCGELDIDEVRKLKGNPYNKRNLQVATDFNMRMYKDIKVNLCGNSYQRTKYLVRIHSKGIIVLNEGSDGKAVLNARFYDENNQKLAEIVHNEWRAYLNNDFWDISYSPGKLKINNRPRDILLEINTLGDAIDLRAKLMYNGVKVNIEKDKLRIDNEANANVCLQGCLFTDKLCGIDVDSDGRVRI